MTEGQMARITSLKARGFKVNTEPIDGYPDWVTIKSPATGTWMYAHLPRDGGKIDRLADWLD